MERTCSECGKAKALEEFRKCKRNAFGRTTVCKECLNNRKLSPETVTRRHLFKQGLIKCIKCGNIKPFDEFGKNNRRSLSRLSECKACRNLRRLTPKVRICRELFEKGLKKCSKCGEVKQIEEFTKTKAYKSGYKTWCKECTAKAARSYHKKNLKKCREKKRRYAGLHLNERKIYLTNYVGAHKDEIRKRQKHWVREGIKHLDDRYVIKIITQVSELPSQTIKKNPDLIESYRQKLILKRQLKSMENEKIVLCKQ